jgi:hypothetical protein
VPTSNAEAVWLDLCGSMPITIIEMGPSTGEPTGSAVVDSPTSSSGAITPLASQPRTGGRKLTSEAGHDTSGRLRPVIIQSAKPVGPHKSEAQGIDGEETPPRSTGSPVQR